MMQTIKPTNDDWYSLSWPHFKWPIDWSEYDGNFGRLEINSHKKVCWIEISAM